MAQILSDISDDLLSKGTIRAVFFDIDGTLLGADGQYSTLTQQAILRIKKLGVKTAVASGRPAFAARHLIRDLGLDDVGQFSAGAHIFNPREGTDIHVSAIPAELCRALISELRQEGLYGELYTRDNYFVEPNADQAITAVHTQYLQCQPVCINFDSLVDAYPIIKVLTVLKTLDEKQKMAKLATQFPQMQFSYAGVVAYPDWQFVSISDKSACKKQAFQYLLDYYKLTAEQVMSIGDAQSDLIFVQQAGVGVAMGNASDELKLSADYITKPVGQDGVAYALSRLIN